MRRLKTTDDDFSAWREVLVFVAVFAVIMGAIVGAMIVDAKARVAAYNEATGSNLHWSAGLFVELHVHGKRQEDGER